MQFINVLWFAYGISLTILIISFCYLLYWIISNISDNINRLNALEGEISERSE